MSEAGAPAPAWLERHRVAVDGLTLDDVIGLRAAKRELASLVARLLHPEIILAAGGDLPRGVIFYGPPGCGKTLLARVMAAMLESAAGGIAFYSVAASDLSAPRFEELSQWLGTRSPDATLVVLYVDEIDLWGRDRDDYRHSDQTRATLLGALAAIDGLDAPASRNRVLWLASSNRGMRELDPALVRAGRFGFSVRVVWPNLAERAEILEFYARLRRVESGIDWRRAAALAGPRTSPAQLRQALDDALALAIADRGAHAAVGWRDIAEAVLRDGRVRDITPPSAARLWETAVHEASHAVANIDLGVVVTSVTIRQEGGATTTESHGECDVDDSPFGAPMLRDRAVVAMAGLAGERLILGRYGLGGGNDVASATRVAKELIRQGAEAAARPVSYGDFEESPLAQDEQFSAVAAIVTGARADAEGLVSRRRNSIESLAQSLLASQHLSGAELELALAQAGLAQPDGQSERLGTRAEPYAPDEPVGFLRPVDSGGRPLPDPEDHERA